MGLVREIKAYEKELGFTETDNFKSYSPETKAYDYFFYTSQTQLPHSLDDPLLKYGTGTSEDFPFDLEKYDIFFYSIQSIADVETPVTKSLMEAALPRFIHIIFHEDWHEQIDLPLGIEEPSAEVVSYSAAMLFAKEKFGQDSEVYTTLRQQLNNKLGESEVYKDYYQQLKNLYSNYRNGAVSETEALRSKDRLLETMEQELQQIWGARPDQLNNALIAFQITYYRYLPLMYRVLSDTGSNLVETISIFRSMPEQGTHFNSVDEIKHIEKEVSK
ncbi:hypothetical protein ACFLV5_03675, partial [Chloroflexota bacterium]